MNAGDFKILSKAIKDSQPTADDALGRELHEKMVRTIAHDIKATHPNFRTGIFMSQCGVERKSNRG